MKKQNVSGKETMIDLDAALSEIAATLRPSASGACGTTQLYNTDPSVATATPPGARTACSCYCCSDTVPR